MKRLVDLIVKNVSAVGKPANRRTFLVVKAAKYGGMKKCPTCPSADSDAPCKACEMEKCGVEAAYSHTQPTKFSDALFQRRVYTIYSTVGDYYGALMDTISGIKDNNEIGDKPAAIKDAVKAFISALGSAMPELLSDLSKSEDELEKAGRKISADRMAKLKTAHQTLAAIIAEQEEADMANEVIKQAPDAGVLKSLGHSIAAMFGRAAGASEETVAELEKAATGNEPAPIDPQVASRLEKAESEAKETKALLEKAAAETKKLRDEIELRKFADEISGYKDLGLDPTKDAALLKAVSETLTPEHAARIREIFKGAAAQRAASALMGEIGSAAPGAPAGSAAAEVDTLVSGLVAKSENATKTRSELMQQIFSERPDLYNKWRNETTVNV